MRLYKLTYYEVGGGFGFHWFKYKRDARKEIALTMQIWTYAAIEAVDFKPTRAGIISLLRQHTPVRNQ